MLSLLNFFAQEGEAIFTGELMPIEQSSSLLEQKETRIQKPKGLLQRINDSKRKTLYALTLALGSLAGGSGTITADEVTPRKTVVQTIEGETDAEEPENNRKDEGVEHLSIDSPQKTFTCTYQGLPVSGHLNERGEVSSLTMDGAQIELTEPVTTKSLEPFLYRALKALDNIRTQMNITEELHLTTLGGARFFFTVQRVSDRHEPLEAPPPGGTSRAPTISSLYVATANDVFLVDSDHEAMRSDAEQSFVDAQEKLLQSIYTITTMQKERYQSLATRRSILREALTERMNREQRHYQSWWRWKRTLDREEREYTKITSQYKDKNGKSSMTQDEYRAIQIQDENHIASWEKFIDIAVNEEERETFETKYNAVVQERDEWQQKKSESRSATLTHILIDEQNGRHITEVTSLVTPKNFKRSWKEGTKDHRQWYEDNQCTEHHVYDGDAWDRKQKYWYYAEGPMQWKYEYAPDKDGHLKFARSTQYWINEKPAMIHDKATGIAEHYTYGGTKIVTEKNYESTTDREVLMHNDDGTTFGTYAAEKKKNPKLSTDEYVAFVASKIHTLERLHFFFDQFMEYKYDTGDYWQTPAETVRRIENGKMRGDCDDYAFLAQAILEKLGIDAHVVLIPGHAICVWARTDADGTFDAWSIDTYYLDTNGKRYGSRTETTAAHGFPKLIDALNALMKKYKYPGLGVSEGQDYRLSENSIEFAYIPSQGSRGTYHASADHFLRKEKK